VALGYYRPAVTTSDPVPLSVVIVTFNSLDAIRVTLPALVPQLEPGDQLIIVDNASQDGTLAAARELAPEAILVENAGNEGFAAAGNAGARVAGGELLLFLNPDAVPAAGFCQRIRSPEREDRGWAAWMGLVTAGGGELVNSRGGEVHFTGISWAGGADEPVETAPSSAGEVPFVSGACFVVRRNAWERQGGFSPHYFMYAEDLDLSLRLRLEGGRLGIEPSARVDHAYEFHKGALKWRLLERNRWATVLRTYPGALLALVAPALLATEVALVAISLAGGWFGQKLLAWVDTVRALPRLLRERRAIQARRQISAYDFAAGLTPALSSPYLGRARRLPGLSAGLRLYWWCVLALLRAAGSGSGRGSEAASATTSGSRLDSRSS
jgi:N-acetylglucosaminyl-diphospho-decaprenol L-rhamnosyltransferase